LYDSWLHVARKKGTSGVDGQEIRDFGSSLEKNLQKIARALQQEDYEPSPLRSVQIPKERKGTFRRLSIPTIQDRIVFQGVNFLLQKLWTPRFSPFSFAYRPGVGVVEAIRTVSAFIREGKHWFAKGDIRGCFDSLSWDILSLALKEWLQDEPLKRLINKAFRVPIVTEGRILPRHKGVPQGSPLSPILANLYLYTFDYEMTAQHFPPIRYGDDWIVLISGESEAADGFQCAAAILSRILIEINTEKSGIGSLEEESIVFLGHKISASGIDASFNGWQRFARALGNFKNARTPEELSRARSELIHLKSFYRNVGTIR
jgi:group II intron reverse transcriptase/maturase